MLVIGASVRLCRRNRSKTTQKSFKDLTQIVLIWLLTRLHEWIHQCTANDASCYHDISLMLAEKGTCHAFIL